MKCNDMFITYKADREEQILEAAKNILEKRFISKTQVSDPSMAGEYLKSRCAHLEHEVFGCVFLNNRHQVLAVEELFRGTVDGCEVHPREVAKRALELNAVALIIYHNHPSGNTEASSADRAITARLKQALGFLDIRILDHIIVAGTQTTSFASRGWL